MWLLWSSSQICWMQNWYLSSHIAILPHAHSGRARFYMCCFWPWSCWLGCYYGLQGCWGNQDNRYRPQPCKVWDGQGVWSHWVCEPQRPQQAHPGGSGGDDWRRCGLFFRVHRKCANHGETLRSNHLTKMEVNNIENTVRICSFIIQVDCQMYVVEPVQRHVVFSEFNRSRM